MWIEQVSVEVDADPVRLWSLFEDVNAWSTWNAGIERIELHGPFADGTEFMMQPPGIEPFVSTLANVRRHESFSDVTVLDATTVKVDHVLTPLASHRTRVTYRAEVTGPKEAELGPMVTADFLDVLNALKRFAENGPRPSHDTTPTRDSVG